MKTNKNQIQQGDVLLHRVSELPPGCKRKAKKGDYHILAEGEVTGHFHGVLVDDDRVLLHEEEDGTLWLQVKEPVEVEHQEHGPVTVDPGIWEVGRVVEGDPFSEELRIVAD
jgi:hypothetical protein